MTFFSRILRSPIFLCIDLFSLSAVFLVVYVLRLRFFYLPLQPLFFYWPFIIFINASFVFSFLWFRLYDDRPLFTLSYLADYLRGGLFWGFLIVTFSFFAKTDYSRILLVATFLGGLTVPFLMRLLVARFVLTPIPYREDRELLEMARALVLISEASSDNLDLVEGFPNRSNFSWARMFLKRIIDIMVSMCGLAVLFVLGPFITLAIRADSSGPTIIFQDRVGKDGKIFRMWKFRTMVYGTALYAPAPLDDDDRRVTRVGRVLRRYSLDELPQLWNVFKGEMSIVGPRPEMPFIVATYNDWQKKRLVVKPGITGLWQVLGRKNLPLTEYLEYDLYYISRQSILFDCVIMLKTVPVILVGRGAY